MKIHYGRSDKTFTGDSVECESYTAEMNERSGLFVLRFYVAQGTERRLIAAAANVVEFSVDRG